MASRTITRSQYFQLVGLITLAEHHNTRLAEIETSVHELLETDSEERRGGGHVSDTVYAMERTPEKLVELLGIEVEGGIPA